MRRCLEFSGRLALVLGLIALLPSSGCQDRGPVRIGYVGGLTGRSADLGVSGRDGVLLAVEEINASGGIGGKPVELLVRDDRQDPEAARRAVRELAAAGAAAIVGPMTSDMALAAVPVADEVRQVLVSPTVSTDSLSGADDHFLRLYPASPVAAEQLAEIARRRLGLHRVAIAYDEGNLSHAQTWRYSFTKSFQEMGGRVAAAEPFRSGKDTSLLDLARRLAATDADGLLVIASAMDTALLCQQLRKLGVVHPVLTSEWAATDDLIAFGGRAVEGLLVFQTFDRDCPLPRYQAFRQRFRERFRSEPRFASVHAYDAANLVFAALARNPDLRRMREGLLALPPRPGLQVELSFTADGDILRPLFLTTVRSGRFVCLERR